MKSKHFKELSTRTAHESKCAQCGSPNVSARLHLEEFRFGEGQNTAELSARVPVYTCDDCGHSFIGSDGESARHEAVCRHLGVMPPATIKELRRNHGLSRAEFAKITRLGLATLGRWERGALIQNPAYDQYLFLLRWPGNIERLKNRAEGEQETSDEESYESSHARFPCLGNFQEVSERNKSFQLVE